MSLVIVIDSDLPVLESLADTFKMPFASRLNVTYNNIELIICIVNININCHTSILGTPLGAGGIPVRLNVPNKLLSLVMALSPSNT